MDVVQEYQRMYLERLVPTTEEQNRKAMLVCAGRVDYADQLEEVLMCLGLIDYRY